mmetsp:Transcript_37955/g.70063  ORF Transcript_37955/g.70063 Transcript_37955/m.70063 type:complete len:394 (-) Transcript_37955:88-1269(-)
MGRRRWRKYAHQTNGAVMKSSPCVESIIRRIKCNDPTLTIIDLRCEKVDHGLIHGLLGALEQNDVVRTLSLGCNDIDDECATSIARVLMRNSSIETLWLGDNFIGSRGANEIADVLGSNSTLKAIDLHSNLLGDEGAESIARKLDSNYSLRWIDLRDNAIHNEGARAICHALDKNGTVTKVLLSWEPGLIWDDDSNNNIDYSIQKAITRKVDGNKSTASEIAYAVKQQKCPPWLLTAPEIPDVALPLAFEKFTSLVGSPYFGGDPKSYVHPNQRRWLRHVTRNQVLSIIFSFVLQKHTEIMGRIGATSAVRTSQEKVEQPRAPNFDQYTNQGDCGCRICLAYSKVCTPKVCGCGICFATGDLCCVHGKRDDCALNGEPANHMRCWFCAKHRAT